MNKEIRKHIKYVTSQNHLVERYDNCKTYFEESTHIDFDQLGFKDSTWHNDEYPSFALDGEGYESVQCFIGDDTWEYVEDGLHRYQLYIDDYCVYSSMELLNVYGFIKSNLDLFKSLVNGYNEKREIEEHNDTMNITINCLNDIYENILSNIFYDTSWDDLKNEYEDKQNDMLDALEKAVDIIKKERK